MVRRDVDRILDIETSSFGHEAWDRSLFDEALEKPPALFLMAKLSGRIAGYAITCIVRDRAELVSIAVFPESRRRGVGEALIRFMLRSLKRRKISVWRLMVRIGNDDAIRFYKGLGFVRVRTVKDYYGPNGDAWAMEMRLQ